MISKTCLNDHIKLWTIGGCWYTTNPPDQILWKKLYSFIVISIGYILNPILMIASIYQVCDLSEMIEALLVMPSAIGGLKSWMLLRKRSSTERLMQLFDQMDAINNVADKYDDIIGKAVRRVKWLTRILGLGYGWSVLFICATPLLTEERRALMWNMWLPFGDYMQSSFVVYVFVLLYQAIMTMLWFPVMVPSDLYASTMYIMLSAHLEVLVSRFLALGHGKLRHRPKVDTELSNCIKMHGMCLE